jgi:hypothetical protein
LWYPLSGRLSIKAGGLMSLSKKPNILFFLSDQHAHSFVGSNPLNPVETPNLDKFSREVSRSPTPIARIRSAFPAEVPF